MSPHSGTTEEPGDNEPGTGSARRPGLRERKKTATMRHVQATALDLFETQGFDAVSIEQVAKEADVSPSTIYRYFGTKEGLVLHDAYDDRLLDALRRNLLAEKSLAASVTVALDEIWDEHFVEDAAETARRIRLFFEIPAVHAQLSLLIDEQIDEIAQTITATGRHDFPRARVLTSAVVWAMIGILRNWYDAGPGEDLSSVRQGIEEFIGWLSAVEGACPAAKTRSQAPRE